MSKRQIDASEPYCFAETNQKKEKERSICLKLNNLCVVRKLIIQDLHVKTL